MTGAIRHRFFVLNKVRLFCVGHVSWRTIQPLPNSPHQVGTWFIQELCKVLEEHGKNNELLWMLTKVCREVAVTRGTENRKKQIPCIVSLLTRSVYFPPKRSLNSSNQVNQWQYRTLYQLPVHIRMWNTFHWKILCSKLFIKFSFSTLTLLMLQLLAAPIFDNWRNARDDVTQIGLLSDNSHVTSMFRKAIST